MAARPFRPSRAAVSCFLVLMFTAAISLPGLFSRAISYDEAITLVQTAGNAYPDAQAASQGTGWPAVPRAVGDLKPRLYGNPSMAEVARQLREGDVHPPLYYWALTSWRQAFGPSLEAARALSLLFSVVAVGLTYALCASAGMKYPAIPSLTFALTASSIDQAQQARSYSMGLALVCAAALVAVTFWRREPKSSTSRNISFAAMALLCCASFLTNYLTLFPVIAIVLWLLAAIQRGRWALLIIGAAVGLATIGPWAPALAQQLGARPDQDAGLLGIGAELAYQLLAYAYNLISPTRAGDAQRLALVAGIVAAAGLGALSLLRTRDSANPRFLGLVWAWALAPAVGVITLNALFDKHLAGERYLAFAVPALAILVTHKIGLYRQPLQSLAYLAAAVLWGAQLFCTNWGYEISGARRVARYRTLAKTVEAAGSANSVLVSGIEYGDGVPASLVYELPASLPVVFVRLDTDPAAMAAVLDRYEKVWQVLAGGPTARVEEAVADRLLELGRQREPSGDAILFRRP